MRQPAPTEFADIGLDAGRFTLATRDEFHGPCPKCGGHDRFVVWTERPFPSWRWMCRVCSPEGGWIDELAPELKRHDPEYQRRRDQWELQRIEREAARKAEIDRRLAQFTTDEIWAAYHRRMQAEQRAWWAAQGVPEEWQDYLKLGYTANKEFNHQGQPMVSPAYTIPYFRPDWQFVTMQYRLTNPPNPSDKYRFEYGLGAPYYMAEPSLGIGSVVIICEGAKKAMVTKIYGDAKAAILAVPSKSGWRASGILEAVAGRDLVFVILDPDAEKDAHALGAAIGKGARVVQLPGKIDDMFTRWGFSADDLRQAMRQAVKARGA